MSDTEAPTAQRAAGRRVVSSLSASQIQHKRDLDRKAQRALRQRTKVRIQELENDLSRFKESVSEREQTMIEEIRQLRDQNRQLRVSLQSIGHFALGRISDIEGPSPTRRGLPGEIQEGLDLPASGSPEPHVAHSHADLAPSLAIPNSGTYPGSEAATPAAQGHESHPPVLPLISGTFISPMPPLPPNTVLPLGSTRSGLGIMSNFFFNLQIIVRQPDQIIHLFHQPTASRIRLLVIQYPQNPPLIMQG